MTVVSIRARAHLTRDPVEATLTTAEQLGLHWAVAMAMQERFAEDLSVHLADIARHSARLAPFGEAPTARAWAVHTAVEALRRMTYEEGVRLYRTALGFDERLSALERYGVLVALRRAAYFAGDVDGCGEAAVAAMEVARRAASPALMGRAALVVEAAVDLRGLAKQLHDDALAAWAWRNTGFGTCPQCASGTCAANAPVPELIRGRIRRCRSSLA